MVFLIQNTQNRDTAALQLKLDELIRSHEGARNRLLQLEELSEEEMDHIKKTFLHLAKTSPRLPRIPNCRPSREPQPAEIRPFGISGNRPDTVGEVG